MLSPEQLYSLNKTEILSGIQCELKLWQEVHHPELAGELEDADRMLMEQGKQVRDLALRRYPNGTLIFTDGFTHEEIYSATQEALKDASIPTLFNATFVHEGVAVRIGVLNRVGVDEFDLVEIKSSSKVKAEHVQDVSLQLWILEGAGIKIRNVKVLFPNSKFTLDEDYQTPDPFKYFVEKDLTKIANEFQNEIEDVVNRMKDVASLKSLPIVEPGSHCKNPHKCQFSEGCFQKLSATPVKDIPNISRKMLDFFAENQIRDKREIPDNLLPVLTIAQQRDVYAAKHLSDSDPPFIETDGLNEKLADVKLPIHFFDLEAVGPAIPIYKGCKPFEVVPFQWSCHTLNDDGTISQNEFYYEKNDNPSSDFCKSLIEHFGKDEGSIIIYSQYETTRLNDLKKRFPEFKDELNGIINRFVDILPMVREHVHHPKKKGSSSIKAVLPIVAPEQSYKDLEIKSGSVAAQMYIESKSPYLMPYKVKEIQTNLEKYVERDTAAMVPVYLVLQPHLIDELGIRVTEDRIPILVPRQRNRHKKRDSTGKFSRK